MRATRVLLALCVWMIVGGVPVAAQDEPPIPPAGARDVPVEVVEYLDALEEAGLEITALIAGVLYDKTFPLEGDREQRGGMLFYVAPKTEAQDSEIGPRPLAARKFAIQFDWLLRGKRRENEEQIYIFDGQWLVEKHPAEKQMVKHQVVRPGETFDPLRIGEGPMPIPIGQKRDEILGRYDVELLEPTAGLTQEDLVEFEGVRLDELHASVANARQIRLTPRVAGADDRFDEIRLWYERDTFYPVMSVTTSVEGNRAIVRLTGVRTGDDALKHIDPSLLDTTAPSKDWNVETREWRGARAAPLVPKGVPGAQAHAFQPVHPEDEEEELPPLEEPPLAEPVRRLLSTSYISEEEARDIRVFHGVWTDADADTPERRARIALITLALDSPSLHDAEAPIEDRAEAMMLRGELPEALNALEEVDTVRAARIRARSLELLGRFDEAIAEIEPLVDRITEKKVATASELVEGVRALEIRLRLKGQEQAEGEDFQTLLALLAHARQNMDRLYWPAAMAEARLLRERDNWNDARTAAMEVLSMCPRSADAWALVGSMNVDSFAFERVEQAVAFLDRLSATPEDDEVRSIPARLLQVRARLRQRDAQGATDKLEPVLARFPEMREALALEVAAAAARYEFEEMEALLEAYDRRSPGSPIPWYEAGRVLSELRQYGPAADLLAEAVRRQPQWPEPHIEWGLMEVQSGRDAEALEALRTATSLDPFNVRASNSLKLVEELLTYERVESEHFIVRYKPGIDALLASEMLEPLEASYDRVTGDGPGGIDFEPSAKTIIDLMPDHRWFAVRIAGLPQIHTMAASTGPVIAMESPREGRGHKVGPYDWDRVLRHEFVHTVTLARTLNRIPHWFTEASAVYLEDAPRDEARCALLTDALTSNRLFGFDEINLAFVRPNQPSDRSQAYAQGHWMYEFIIDRWGARAPLDLMDEYARGRTEGDAFEDVLGVTRSEFFDEFREWAFEQAREWGMLPPDGVPSIRELLARGVREELAASGMNMDDVADADLALPNPTPDMIRGWLDEYPDHPQVLALAADVLLAFDVDPDGRLKEAQVEVLRRLADASPVSELPHRMLARHALAGGKGVDPIPHLEYLDVREQRSAAYAQELALQYARRRDIASATRKATRAIQIAPFDADYRELAARVALLAQDFDTARHHIEVMIELEPDQPVHRQRLEALIAMEQAAPPSSNTAR